MSGLIATRGTDERKAIRNLIDFRLRGFSLVKSFFVGTIITLQDIEAIYLGKEVEEDKWTIVKKVLKERMTKD